MNKENFETIANIYSSFRVIIYCFRIELKPKATPVELFARPIHSPKALVISWKWWLRPDMTENYWNVKQKQNERIFFSSLIHCLVLFSHYFSLQQDNDPQFLRLCKALSLSIAYAANVGGIGSLTGTGPNLVFKGQLDK